jgi:hypothetical protein
MPGNKIFIIMKATLKEALPAMIPEYPIEVAGHHLTLRFDVNINKTKKGVKLQFILKDVPQDPRQLQQMANQIGTELQEKFAAADMQIVYDVENPYKNVIGFLLPLPSLANRIIKNVFKGGAESSQEQMPAEELPTDQPTEKMPVKELPPVEEEPMKEWIMRMAGLKK